MQILVFLDQHKPLLTPPLEVLDASADVDTWVPLLKRAIATDRLPDQEKTQTLLDALSDRVEFTRDVAMHSLMQGPQCGNGSPCREKAVTILSQEARQGLEARRITAIGWLFQYLYDPGAKNTQANRQIVSNLLALVTDPDANIRSAAIVALDNVFFAGANWVPDIKTFEIPNRVDVVNELEKEQRDGWPDAYKAKRLEEIIRSAARGAN